MVATQVPNIYFGLAFHDNFKKEPRIGDIEIFLSQIKGSITTHSAMIQLSNISGGGNQQS